MRGTYSPRKEIHPEKLRYLVDKLTARGFFVLQAGRLHDLHIRNAYSVLGLTTPRQAISLLSRYDLVISPDNFFTYATHLTGAPALISGGLPMATRNSTMSGPNHCVRTWRRVSARNCRHILQHEGKATQNGKWILAQKNKNNLIISTIDWKS